MSAMAGLIGFMLLSSAIGVAITASPAAAADPICTPQRVGLTAATASCVNGDPTINYRLTILCDLPPTDGVFIYSVSSPWTPTTQQTLVNCVAGGVVVSAVTTLEPPPPSPRPPWEPPEPCRPLCP